MAPRRKGTKNLFRNLRIYSFLGVSGTNLDSNIGASREIGEPLITGDDGGASVWYSWTAPSNGIVTLDTIGSDFDTLLGVYVGNSVDALTLVAEDDDSGLGVTSSLAFNAVAGTKFYFVVDGFLGDEGNITLEWVTAVPLVPPSNDNFANATV